MNCAHCGEAVIDLMNYEIGDILTLTFTNGRNCYIVSNDTSGRRFLFDIANSQAVLIADLRPLDVLRYNRVNYIQAEVNNRTILDMRRKS